MSVAVVVPWRPAGPERGRAWGYVNRWWATTHPTWPVHVALAPAGPWCKAAAIAPAVEATPADIVVIADADVICDGLPEAVEAVKDGARWAIPHRLVHRLTPRGTDQLLAGDLTTPRDTLERPYQGVEGGGIVVLPREVIRSIPPDHRFVGWGRPGQEDVSWALALNTLAGRAWRGDADLLHLFHPAQPRLNRKVGSDQGRQLHRQYLRARRDPAAMRRLVAEGRRHDARSPDESAVHDHAA